MQWRRCFNTKASASYITLITPRLNSIQKGVRNYISKRIHTFNHEHRFEAFQRDKGRGVGRDKTVRTSHLWNLHTVVDYAFSNALMWAVTASGHGPTGAGRSPLFPVLHSGGSPTVDDPSRGFSIIHQLAR